MHPAIRRLVAAADGALLLFGDIAPRDGAEFPGNRGEGFHHVGEVDRKANPSNYSKADHCMIRATLNGLRQNKELLLVIRDCLILAPFQAAHNQSHVGRKLRA